MSESVQPSGSAPDPAGSDENVRVVPPPEPEPRSVLYRHREQLTARPRSFDFAIEVDANADALSTIRHAVGGMATALGADAAASADVRLALTEVCSAAVKRAAGTDSTLWVRAELQDHGVLCVVATDDAPSIGGPEGGFPLPLVAALTETLELRRAPGGGTEVAMTFVLRG